MEPERQAGAATGTAEDEALKRNTDCVYFLASPLTCKKGVECEYRHSEGARINPRDCWYWLNGNCLNPKCSFRHPPLDGLMGISSQATSARFPISYLPASHYPNKQNIPCYYFQKGGCLKGDLCPFMHGPEPKKATTVAKQAPNVSNHDSAPAPPVKKASPIQGEPDPRVQTSPENCLLPRNSVQPDIECSPKSQTSSVPVSTGVDSRRHLSYQSEAIDHRLPDDGECDEFLHESSPGFDVLVNGHLEDPMYFHNKEDFGDATVHDLSLNPARDFVNPHASDDDTSVRYESVQYNEMGEYGRYMAVHDCHGRPYHDSSPERLGSRSFMSNRRRRRSQIDEKPIDIDGSDLRLQLQKKRMRNGSRSSISPDRCMFYGNAGRLTEEYKRQGHNSSRELRFPRESTISKRLQGRITPSRRSRSENHGDFHSGRGRNRGGRLTDRHGRLHSRINLRQNNEHFSLEERNASARSAQMGEDIVDFAGPKSLSELKVHKSSNNTEQRSMDNSSTILSRDEKYMKLRKPGHSEAESCSFEGPKPLSVILKRKRELQNGQGAIDATTATSAMNVNVGHSLDSEQECVETYETTNESERRVVGTEHKDQIPVDQEKQKKVHSSPREGTHETEDDEINRVEYPEFENYEQGDDEYEYEVEEGEEFKEDYENACHENEEYLEEEGNEEGGNFNEKFSVLFS